MLHDVVGYVASFAKCQQAKNATGAPRRLLQPTPQSPQCAMSLDFLTDLPDFKGPTTILVAS